MDINSKIYVAGHKGLVGSALVDTLTAHGYNNLIVRSHAELDLTNQPAVEIFFQSEKPEYVFLAAAKVGGIHANNTYPAEFIYENLAIQANVIHQSYLNNVKRLLFLGSSCIYPKDCPQPIKEEYLLSAELEPTNRPYALAKIAGIEMCWSYNRQYGTKYLAAMPTNLYGLNDNYHAENSHVIPGLIRRFHEAKVNSHPTVTIWGSGKPKREFLFNQDMAEACLFLMQQPENKLRNLINNLHPPLVNIGCGNDLTIIELAKLIKKIVGYEGKIELDSTKPDGTMRKLMDVTFMHSLGWHATTGLEDGLNMTYQAYQKKIRS